MSEKENMVMLLCNAAKQYQKGVMLLTSYGTITGEITTEYSNSDFASYYKVSGNKKISILLKDVSISSGVKIPELVIFFDEIIGFTFIP